MNLWESRAAQAANEESGITVRVDQYPGVSFVVRPLCDWNPHLQRAQVALAQRPEVQAYMARFKLPGYVPTEDDKKLDADMVRDAFADGCIVSFEGFPAKSGKGKMAYSKENARLILAHFPDIYAALKRTASDLRNYAPKDKAALASDVLGN